MIDLRKYGYTGERAPGGGLTPGRITEQRRDMYTVMTGRGEVSAVLTGAFYHAAEAREDFPCVGDFVLIKYNESGDSGITELLPRRSKFSRADFSGHAAGYVKTILEQVIAANFDYVFILSSLNKDFSVSRIMRYITQSTNSGGLPVVILTKADLASDAEHNIDQVRIAAPGTPVHAVSSLTGAGLNALGEYLRPGSTAVLLGMSGVGKSSLINALMNDEVMAVKSIREDDSRGRHTTTHRQLFALPSGGLVIDTPGMRELGLFGADEAISAGFSDIEQLFSGCRFSDCRHQAEPGCAVRAALEDGSLPPERWDRYLAQIKESAFTNDKAAALADRRAKGKSLAIYSKKMKKNGEIHK